MAEAFPGTSREIGDKSKKRRKQTRTHTKKYFEEDSSHGLAKRVILHKILQAVIRYYLYTDYKRFIYMDLFAGSGTYGQDYDPKDQGTMDTSKICKFGSPVIALHNIQDAFMSLEHHPTKIFRDIKADMVMVEANEKHMKKLQNTMGMIEGRAEYDDTIKCRLHYINEKLENCVGDLRKYLNKKYRHVNVNFVPTFSFIDPFGYSMIPMDIVERFLGDGKTVLINFMVGFFDRFKKVKQETIDKLFGSDEWQNVSHELPAHERYKRYVNLYEKQLMTKGAKYTLAFAMKNNRNVLIYYLIFATDYIGILEKAKEALNRVTQETDEFQFSGYYIRKDLKEMEWSNHQDNDKLADDIWKQFKGVYIKGGIGLFDIKYFVLVNTPYIYRKDPLKKLFQHGKLIYETETKKRGSFPDGTKVNFACDEKEAERNRRLEFPQTYKDEAKAIWRRFKGKEDVPVERIKPLRWKTSLKHLLAKGKISCRYPPHRGKALFPKGTIVDFVSTKKH